jgi:hypothetical protein
MLGMLCEFFFYEEEEEKNPIYDISICKCVHIVFYYTFLFIVHLQFLQCCIFVLYLPVHIPVFLWMRGGSYFTHLHMLMSYIGFISGKAEKHRKNIS